MLDGPLGLNSLELNTFQEPLESSAVRRRKQSNTLAHLWIAATFVLGVVMFLIILIVSQAEYDRSGLEEPIPPIGPRSPSARVPDPVSPNPVKSPTDTEPKPDRTKPSGDPGDNSNPPPVKPEPPKPPDNPPGVGTPGGTPGEEKPKVTPPEEQPKASGAEAPQNGAAKTKAEAFQYLPQVGLAAKRKRKRPEGAGCARRPDRRGTHTAIGRRVISHRFGAVGVQTP